MAGMCSILLLFRNKYVEFLILMCHFNVQVFNITSGIQIVNCF